MPLIGQYVLRAAGAALRAAAATNPIVAILGPRQSGKTTLARETFPDRPYVNLEDPSVRAFALEDARGFLEQYPEGALLDEAQRAPQLFSYLQVRVDASGRPGQYILTGSAQLDLHAGVSQSLAGRVAFVRLLPFSYDELEAAERAPASIEQAMFAGGYPPIHDRSADPRQWYADYISTYVERDVRQLLNVQDVALFQRFLSLCAGNVGQLLNLTRIAADAGISANTAKAWLSVLQTTFVSIVLRSHHRNFRKRIVKAPKLYFCDTGLVTRLLEIESPEQLRTHPLRGPLFENWVVTELLKGRFGRGRSDNLYFWRNHTGEEIDVLVDRGTSLLPIECKSGKTVSSDWLEPARRFEALAGDMAEPGVVVHGGDDSQTRGRHRLLSWRAIAKLANEI